MPTYAIGDIQGCYAEFQALLDAVEFEPQYDKLWLVGDLVNRGPASLEVMRLVMSFGDSVLTVLGNHDLHFLAIYYGGHKPHGGDTFDALLDAPDVAEIADWFREQRFFHHDDRLGYAMVHAGLPPDWSFQAADAYSEEVMAVIRGKRFEAYFADLYGNQPDVWSDAHSGMARWRVLTNYFTRMRLIDDDGRMDFDHKGGLEDAPPGWLPWYELTAPALGDERLLFGHWAALEGYTGYDNIIGLDTGCVWGRTLTALCLETGAIVTVPASPTAVS